MTLPPPPPPPPAQPQPPQQPAMGTVHLTIQGSMMTSNAITPSAWINGYPVRVQYGQNPIPVPAGPVRVDMSAQWLRTYGQASLEFTLAPGQTVPVFYAAPMHQWSDGSIGFTQVQRKGVGFFVGLMAVVAIACTVAIVLSLSQL